MDLRKIKKLIDLLEESNLAELEIKEGEETIRLSRMPKGVAMAAPVAPLLPAPVTHVHVEQRPHPAHHGADETAAAGGKSLPDGLVIRSPMVGTFYGSPNPDA